MPISYVIEWDYANGNLINETIIVYHCLCCSHTISPPLIPMTRSLDARDSTNEAENVDLDSVFSIVGDDVGFCKLYYNLDADDNSTTITPISSDAA